ncbi:5455_t:CDS:2 [Funneliformis mosseae]|uniref:5455_t:CDS:1 n=1 Tax=Funneliformis mosseae TaxID=27381 RepID=A0A9N8VE64_FUNMO|nr:5455_t:CDS:2 [Funneliformis mosseae]
MSIMSIIDKWFTRRWAKINESIWTRLFILTSVMQTILVIVLETRVFERNNSIRLYVKSFQNIGDITCKFDSAEQRMLRIEQENFIFIIFQLYQLWFCFNAIFAQNTIQLFAITIVNTICSVYSFVQIAEVKIWYTDLNNSCSQKFTKQTNTKLYDLPLIITLVTFLLLMGFLAFKLYQQFGWKIYKKIGGSPKIQTIYRRQLILVILLKVDLIFLLLFAIESWMTFALETKTSQLEHLYYVPRIIYYFHRIATFLIIILEIIAYRSIKNEWRCGMLIFIFLWMAVIVNLILVLIFSIRTAEDSWYFLIVFVSVSIVISTITWVYSILVTKDFGSELKKILIQYKEKSSRVTIDDGSESPRRISID